MSWLYVSDVPAYVRRCIARGAVPFRAVKCAEVLARQGTEGERVETVLSDGTAETVNRITADKETGRPDWIVQNPGGEQYIVRDRVFREKYLPHPEKPGVYLPQSPPVTAVRTEEDIRFPTRWGEMSLKAGGYLLLQPDGEIYGVQREAFLKTYRQIDESD